MRCENLFKLYRSLVDGCKNLFFASDRSIAMSDLPELEKDFNTNFQKIIELLSTIDDVELFLLRGFLSRNLNGRFVGEFNNDIAVIHRMDGSYGYIKKTGVMLNDQKYKKCYGFTEGIGTVEDFDGSYYFIKEDGERLNDKKYKTFFNFQNGFAVVQRFNGFWNFVKKDGTELNNINYLSGESYFRGDFIPVRMCDEKIVPVKFFENYIKKDGTHLNDTKYQRCFRFHNGFMRVIESDGLYYFLNPAGEKVIKKGYVFANNFENGVASVKEDDGLWRFIKSDGSYLSNKSYLECGCFVEGCARVKKQNGFWNYINLDGKELNDKDYLTCENFQNDFAKICILEEYMDGGISRTSGNCNFIKKDGTYLNHRQYGASSRNFSNTMAAVKRELRSFSPVQNYWDFIDEKGRPLCMRDGSASRFSEVSDFFKNCAIVKNIDEEVFRILRRDGDMYVLSDETYFTYDVCTLDNGFKFFILIESLTVILDESGERLTQDRYDFVVKEGNLLFVKNVKEDKPYYIDKKGRRIFEYPF